MATYDLAYPGAAIDAILNTAYFLQEAGYIFQGSASEYSGTPSKRVWLIAPAGFTGLGLSSAVPQGSFGICLYNGTAWVGKVINVLTLDSAPTRNSQNGVTSGGVAATLDEIAGGIMETFASLLFDDETASADLRTKLSYAVKFSVSDVYQTVTHLNILAATTSKAGLMSAEDKAKVDSFLANLRSLTFTDTTASADQGTKITETLKATIGGVQEVIDSITLLAATSSKAGLLSASDKAYIDALPATLTSLSNSISGALALMQSLVGYYVCDTAAGTAAKTVDATGYSLTDGGCIRIKMTNANTANNVTLNINSTGAKALYYDGAQASATNTWEDGEVLEVYYDGTQYQCASGGGGKFATGEKVKDISISQTVDGSPDSLISGAGVMEAVAPLINAEAHLSNWTLQENKAMNCPSSTSVVSMVASNNVDTYTIQWSTGGRLHIKCGGCFNADDLIVGFFNTTTAETSSLIMAYNTNNNNVVYETTMDIPAGTKLITVSNRKINLATPELDISASASVSDAVIDEKIGKIVNGYSVYGISAITSSALSNGTTLVDGFAAVAGHTYMITCEKKTENAPDIIVAMGSNDTIRKLISDKMVFAYTPKTASASCRLYSKSSAAAGNTYQWTIQDITTPNAMPVLETVEPLVFSKADGDAIVEYLTDKYDNFVYKNGTMPEKKTAAITFVDGFGVTSGHKYKVRIKTSAALGVAFKIGLGSNGTFPQIDAAEDTTQWTERQMTATTTTSSSRIYFEYPTAPSSYPTAELYLYDVTDPTTLPRVIVHVGLETKLQTEIDAIAAMTGGGGGNAATLFCGYLSTGLWSTNGRSTSAGLCTDRMVYPWNSMRVKVNLPSSLSCRIVTGTSQTMTAQSDWLVDGDVYAMPISRGNHKHGSVTQHSSYYAVCFTDKNDHTTCSVSKTDLEALIKEGAVSLVVDGKETSLIAPLADSDRYVRRKHDATKPVIVHVSDVHGDRHRYNRALDYADSLAASVLINTGDSVSYNATDGCLFIPNDALNHDLPVLTAVGNHDMISNTSGVWFSQITQPLVEKCGYMKAANTPATDNNYYVDIAEFSIRCIVLENYFGMSYNVNMVTWLVSALASVPAGYGVIIAEHNLDERGTGNVFNDGTPTEFTNLNLRGIVDLFIAGSSGTVTIKDGSTVSCDFTQALSNEFICWVAGHSHVDFVGYYDDTTYRQVVCQVDSTCAVQGVASLPRDIEGTIQDSFNVLQIDRTNHKILAMKVGSNVTVNDVSITTAEISYV